MKNVRLINVFIISLLICTSCVSEKYLLKNEYNNCDCNSVSNDCDSDEDIINNPDCIKVYSDTHLFGIEKEVPNSRKNMYYNINYLNRVFPVFKQKTFYTGDIIDLSQAPPGEKKKARELIAALRTSAGKNYIRGNHEMDSFGGIGEYRHTIYNNHVLFLHGHQLRYPQERTNYLESSRMPKQTREDWGPSRSTNEVFLEALKEARKYNCNTVIFGHTHPDSLDERTIDGIRLINVKQGCTFLYLPSISNKMNRED